MSDQDTWVKDERKDMFEGMLREFVRRGQAAAEATRPYVELSEEERAPRVLHNILDQIWGEARGAVQFLAEAEDRGERVPQEFTVTGALNMPQVTGWPDGAQVKVALTIVEHSEENEYTQDDYEEAEDE